MGLEDSWKDKDMRSNLARAPKKVRDAAFAGNTEALKAFGRAGAKQKMENEDAARFMDEHIAAKHAADEAFRQEQSGEDLLPPDSIN